MPTFREAACAVHEANKPRWRKRQAHSQLDADFGASRHADTWQHTPGSYRPRRRAGSPKPDMADPAGDSPAGASTDENRLPMGNGAWFHGDQPGRRSHSTAHCPPCRKLRHISERCPIKKSGLHSKPLKSPKPQSQPSCASSFWFSRRARSGECPGEPPGTRSTSGTKYGEYHPSG